MNKPKFYLAMLAVAAIALTACSGSDDSTAPSTNPAVPSCAVDAIACHLTKDSGVHGVPLPDDAVALEETLADVRVSSELSGLTEVTQAYSDVMADNGWTFDAADSVIDPAVAESEKMGRITDAVYCKTGPERWVAIILSDSPSGGIHVGLVNLDPETGCDALTR